MIAVGTGEEIHHFPQPFHTLGTVDEAAVDAYEQARNAEAAAAGSHYVRIVFGIDAVEMYALRSHTRIGFGAVPHIIKVYTLYVVEHDTVVGEAFGAAVVLHFSAVRTAVKRLCGAA